MSGKKPRSPGRGLMAAGLTLMAAALLLTGYNLWEEHRAEQSAVRVLAALEPITAEAGPVRDSGETDPRETEIPDYLLAPEMEMPTAAVEDRDYIGVLEIPALGVSLPVMSRWSYPDLKQAPCRYAGSAYQGDLIIAGHNYPSHFGGLKKLSPGDAVSFRDVDGNSFAYTVAELETLDPCAVEEMEAGDWDLTLFTCTVGGKARVTVRCTADNG